MVGGGLVVVLHCKAVRGKILFLLGLGGDAWVRVGFVAVRKAIWPLRLRLHSGLRQSGMRLRRGSLPGASPQAGMCRAAGSLLGVGVLVSLEIGVRLN